MCLCINAAFFVCLISSHCLSVLPSLSCAAAYQPRLEPEILLRAKQDFMKIDSDADLEWVRPLQYACFVKGFSRWWFIFFQYLSVAQFTFGVETSFVSDCTYIWFNLVRFSTGIIQYHIVMCLLSPYWDQIALSSLNYRSSLFIVLVLLKEPHRHMPAKSYV